VFIKTLYPPKVPIALGLDIELTAIIGLILNYTPWGIRLAPITLSLLALTLVFATAVSYANIKQKLNRLSRGAYFALSRQNSVCDSSSGSNQYDRNQNDGEYNVS
jgi:uncharacterized membrane protein